jgi:hypothetical protein
VGVQVQDVVEESLQEFHAGRNLAEAALACKGFAFPLRERPAAHNLLDRPANFRSRRVGFFR